MEPVDLLELVLLRCKEKINRLHSWCCPHPTPLHKKKKILIILNYSWYWWQGASVKFGIYFISGKPAIMPVGFRPLDSVTSLIHILSKPDVICIRMSPNSVDVTRPRQGITTRLSY